jgi:hypothetical protein
VPLAPSSPRKRGEVKPVLVARACVTFTGNAL